MKNFFWHIFLLLKIYFLSLLTLINYIKFLSRHFIFREPMYGLPLPPKGDEIVCGELNISFFHTCFYFRHAKHGYYRNINDM